MRLSLSLCLGTAAWVLCILLVTFRVALAVPLSAQRVDTFIDYATSYLVRVSHTEEQDPEFPGKFTYITYLGNELQLDGFDKRPQKSYNLLRHNGAIYALAVSYQRRPNHQVKEAILRGVHYLKSHAIGPVPDTVANDGTYMAGMLAPWETTHADPSNGPLRAKLGGAGLGLIALCNAELVAPGTTQVEYMRQIGNFIVYLQKEDGSFSSRFGSKMGKDDSWTSLYYPGEAALGLVYLSELETDPNYRVKWLHAATETLLYLEQLRRTMPLDKIEPDHWALLASARLLPQIDPDSIEYWLVYNHAVRVVQSILISATEKELEEHNGCHTLDRRTCPTATRMEGFLAAYTFVKDHEMFLDEEEHKVVPLRDRMLHDIELSINFLLQAQQQSEENNLQGAVPVKFPVQYHDDGEVRVDYVQHAVSAVIAYETHILNAGSSSSSSLTDIFHPAIHEGLMLMLGFVVVAFLVLWVLQRSRGQKARRHVE